MRQAKGSKMLRQITLAAALCLALPVNAEEAKTQGQLAEVIAEQGYIPVSMIRNAADLCEGMLNNFGDAEETSRLGMEYCGVMLFSAVAMAMDFQVGEPPLSVLERNRQNELLNQQVAALRTQLADALAEKIATQTLLENLKAEAENYAASPDQQIAALGVQLRDLRALLEDAELRDVRCP